VLNAVGKKYGWLAADKPYKGACCPSGWQCMRKDQSFWQCRPTAVLDTCSGARTIATGQLCGGTSLCGKDGVCGNCCVDGSVCIRQISTTWTCQSLSDFRMPPSPPPPKVSSASSVKAPAARG
jgi:hypothetical protein